MKQIEMLVSNKLFIDSKNYLQIS